MQTPIHELETPRLRMRQWLPADREPFARLSADPQVMRYFPTMMNRQEADSFADRMQGKMQANGWGFWVLERKSDGQFLGFTGLNNPPAELPFSPCVEIGWRLTRESWGLGYASEAATRALDFAFEKLDTDKVYAFTAVPNERSAAVMRRIGMTDTGERFMHPAVPEGHELQEHLLYAITREQWPVRQIAEPVSVDTARRYVWGEVCEGWPLLKQADLSVIQERVPAGAGEVRHYHAQARQFFYILSGCATVECGDQRVELTAGQGLHVMRGLAHRFANHSAEDVTFLVISTPTTAGDRVNLPAAE